MGYRFCGVLDKAEQATARSACHASGTGSLKLLVKHILYVEDNPSDLAAAREALREIGAPIMLHGVENAVQAYRFLAKRDGFRDAPRPDAILLDLNLPVMSGQRVLEEIRSDPSWTSILVVMITSSPRQEDRAAAERLGARFITKPSRWADYLVLARQLEQCLAARACISDATD